MNDTQRNWLATIRESIAILTNGYSRCMAADYTICHGPLTISVVSIDPISASQNELLVKLCACAFHDNPAFYFSVVKDLREEYKFQGLQPNSSVAQPANSADSTEK